MAETKQPGDHQDVGLGDIGPEAEQSQVQSQSQTTKKEEAQFRHGRAAALAELARNGGILSSLFGYGSIATKNAAIGLLFLLVPTWIVLVAVGSWDTGPTRFLEFMIGAFIGVLLGQRPKPPIE